MNPVLTPTNNMVVQAIFDVLSRIAEEIGANAKKDRRVSNQEWIEGIIMPMLTQAGKDLGYKISGSGNSNPGLLYDMMWKEELSSGAPVLVVESSLGSQYFGIKEDFEKLLMASAQLRLIITYGGENKEDHNRASEIISKLKRNIGYSIMSQSGDSFLFATVVLDGAGGCSIMTEFLEKP